MFSAPRKTFLARDLRRNSTEAEKLMWYRLRRKQLSGVKFGRQQPLGKYIVDFISYEAQLVIELDGSQHMEEGNFNNDKIRTAYFSWKGFHVLRFWNNDVLQNIDGVMAKVISSLTPTLSLREREKGEV